MEAVVKQGYKSPGHKGAGGVVISCAAGRRALLLLPFTRPNLKYLKFGPWTCLVHGC